MNKDEKPQSLPYSEDGEKGVLCCLILSPKEVANVCECRLRPEMFHVPAHKLLYELLMEFAEEGKPTKFPLVKQALKERGLLEEVGGPEFLNVLYNFVPTAAGAGDYIAILREQYGLRRLTLLSGKLSDECKGGQADGGSVLACAVPEVGRNIQ